MSLSLHNTFSRKKEPFRPLDPSNVRVYVCGPTVYDYAHIGNARPVVVFDVLFRLLRRLYGETHVTYVRNITDVDDKINAASQASGEPIRAITERTAKAFREDMAALGALPPTVEPRATEHVAGMIAMIADLIAKGHAYAAEGHVLFSVASMPDYGKLSGRSIDEMIAGARVEVAPYKKDPADFVLWKPSDATLPGWDSPWGRGRPGWHIECSAMSCEYLGETFDIHGGGADLIFPHHENEIAQSICAHGSGTFARYWMHNGYLMVGGEKMSKSLGNFLVVHDLLKEFPGEAIRLLLLKTHYRHPLDFTKERIVSAKAELDRFYTALLIAKQNVELRKVDPPEEIMIELCDDLDTPMAITRLHDITSDLNNATAPGKAIDHEKIADLASKLVAGGELLGIVQQDPEEWRRWQPEGTGGLDDATIDDLIAQRNAARKSKNFAEADRIRKLLSDAGIVLEDGAQGTTWRRA